MRATPSSNARLAGTSAAALAFALGFLALFAEEARGQADVSGTLVVVNKAANTANIIDIASRQIVATLPTGRGPHEVVMSADGRIAVVTDYGGRNANRTLTVIDVENLEVIRTIDLGEHSRPHGIDYLPGDSLVAVTSEDSRHVVVVRVADGEIVAAIPTDADGSHMLAMVADGGLIYTSNIGGNSVSELLVRDGRRARTFSVPARPEAIGVTPGGEEVWVGSNAEGTVNVIDTESGEVSEALTGFGWPYRVLFTNDARLVLLPDLRGEELRIVDRVSRQELAVLPFAEGGPQGITLTDDARVAFLSLSRQNQIVIIDLRSRQVIGKIETGAGPDGVAYSRSVVRAK